MEKVKNTMKSVVVCIASKKEKDYIEEWIKYNFYIGFTDIIIYDNHDCFSYLSSSNIHIIKWPGFTVQLNAYNDFLKKYSYDYDCALIIDCDEFLNLKIYKNIEDFYKNYQNFFAVSLNWRFFGTSNIQQFNTEKSVLKRFIYCQKNLDCHTKLFLNLALCKKFNKIGSLKMYSTHNVSISYTQHFSINSSKTHFIHGSKNKNTMQSDLNFPYIHHYFTKTLIEYRDRRSIGNQRKTPSDDDFKRNLADFDKYNYNEIISLDLYNIGVIIN